jgi:hypothetical protein
MPKAVARMIASGGSRLLSFCHRPGTGDRKSDSAERERPCANVSHGAVYVML